MNSKEVAALLGGTISWMTLSKDKVRFTFRLTWEKGTGPCGQNCSNVDLYKLGSVPATLSMLQWQCVSGCSTKMKLSDINTKLTSVSISSGWEQGEQYFFHDNPSNLRYTVSLDGIPWTVSATGMGRLVTTIDLRTRNDSKLPNASPVAAVPPTIGIPFGCPSTILLPVEDPDADDILARVAYPNECGGACTTLPKFVLKPSLGQLIIDATSNNGYTAGKFYRVALMIEDYPTYTIKVGNETITPRHAISKIPLQFTIKVIQDKNSCYDKKMKFVQPTREDGYRISYKGHIAVGDFKNGVYLESPNPNSTEFMTSVPGGMKTQLLPDDNRRLNVSRVYSSWKPPQDQSGDNIICVWGNNPNGITTETRCVVGLINDMDGCQMKQIKCQHNGTCVNLWHRVTCKCPHGFKPRDCTEKVTCLDFPCKNNGTCVDTGTAFICVCAPGYTGVDCQTEIDECSSSPCKHGRCINDINKFSCSCYPNFTGIFCETEHPLKETAPSPSEDFWPLIGSCVAGAAALAAAAACCWWCFLGAAARRRKKKQKIHPENAPAKGNNEPTSNDTTPQNRTERISSIPQLPPLKIDLVRQRRSSQSGPTELPAQKNNNQSNTMPLDDW